MRSTRLMVPLLVLLLAVPAIAATVTVEGKDFPDTVTVEGKALKRVGAGLREKWMFNVYAMGAYSESGSCDTSAIIGKDEVKHLRLEMLRNVSGEKMGNTIGGSFREHMPANASDQLKAQSETFQGYFKDECSKGSVLEFTYVPGTGTLLRQNGKSLGAPIPGSEFARILWDIYFGGNTCCKDLKKQILSGCGQ
jgi:hypothetical protein